MPNTTPRKAPQLRTFREILFGELDANWKPRANQQNGDFFRELKFVASVKNL
jgi:hypothetical protein